MLPVILAGCLSKDMATSSPAGSPHTVRDFTSATMVESAGDIAEESYSDGIAAGPMGADFGDDMADAPMLRHSPPATHEMAMSMPDRESMEAMGGNFAMGVHADQRGTRQAGASPASVAPTSADPQHRPNREVALAKPAGDNAVAIPDETQPAAKDPEDHGRQIIYTAAMAIDVWDVDEAVDKAEALPATYGGYVQQRRAGVIVLKIPAAKLRAAMDDLHTWGIVHERQLQAQDVTAEYTDLQSRIRVLRETQGQLIALLKQAKSVEEALHVRQALDQVTMELELALGRMRQLSDSI